MPLSIYESNNLFVLKENIFDLNEYLFGPKIFCLDYQMLFNSNKSFVWIKKEPLKQTILFYSIKYFSRVCWIKI